MFPEANSTEIVMSLQIGAAVFIYVTTVFSASALALLIAFEPLINRKDQDDPKQTSPRAAQADPPLRRAA